MSGIIYPILMIFLMFLSVIELPGLRKFHFDAHVFLPKFMHIKTLGYTFVHEKFSKQ